MSACTSLHYGSCQGCISHVCLQHKFRLRLHGRLLVSDAFSKLWNTGSFGSAAVSVHEKSEAHLDAHMQVSK